MGDLMLYKIINNFYFIRLLYIVLFVILGFAVIDSLKTKDGIMINKYLNVKKISISLLLKYFFLSFIVRITLEQLVTLINVPSTEAQIPSTVFEIIIEFITTCIFAPIFEEIIFRFGLYKKLNKKFNVFISILITSLVFSLFHFYKIDGLIVIIGISIIWNYLFYKTDNLFYSIVLHLFHNIYALIDNLLNYSSYWYILLFISILGFLISAKKQKN